MDIPTPLQLQAMLEGVRLDAVAERAGVSLRTVYRLRNAENYPRLDTLARVVSAVKAVKRRK